MTRRDTPLNPNPSAPNAPGEVLGHGYPDWPDDLKTFAERKAYQLGVGDARWVDAHEMMTLQEVWQTAGGNPEVKPTRDEVVAALRMLDAVCDEAAALRTPSEESAYTMGAKGGPVVQAERLAFEAWMRGHCWTVVGEWDGATYKHPHESTGFVHSGAMDTRRLWAAWRDRAALSGAAPAAQAANASDREAELRKALEHIASAALDISVERHVIAHAARTALACAGRNEQAAAVTPHETEARLQAEIGHSVAEIERLVRLLAKEAHSYAATPEIDVDGTAQMLCVAVNRLAGSRLMLPKASDRSSELPTAKAEPQTGRSTIRRRP